MAAGFSRGSTSAKPEGTRMEPLDLSNQPPRSPRESLAGLDLIMAARSVDKFRALLPGGNIGLYLIPGYTTRMLDVLGLTQDEFRDAVMRAASDANVAEWLRSRTTPEQRAELNAILEARTVALRINDADFRERYPYASTLPLDMKLLDLLDEDDRRLFATP